MCVDAQTYRQRPAGYAETYACFLYPNKYYEINEIIFTIKKPCFISYWVYYLSEP